MATPKMTWAKIEPLKTSVNLLDITTEQLAESLEEGKLSKYFDDDNSNVMRMDEQKGETNKMNDTDDEIIAHTLQNEFNLEYNSMLRNVENKLNRDAKVRTSYTNYRVSSHDIEEDNIDSDDSKGDFDRFVSIEKEYASIPRCGYKKTEGGSQVVTKHDISMTSRINACRVLEFPPGMNTGDIGSFDAKLNNKVYNNLRMHSHAQKKKGKPSIKPKV